MTGVTYPGFPVGGGFASIIADPPWNYRQKFRSGSHCPYPTMTDDEIFGLPVREAAAENSLLLLWTTNAKMGVAIECAREWGFEQKTILTWVKTTSSGRPRAGTGFWFRGATEHALFCVRGKVRAPRTRAVAGEKMPLYTTAILAPRGPHSEKPGVQFEIMEAFGPPPRLDLFARSHHLGWASWGNEVRAHHSMGTHPAFPTGVPA